MRSSGIIRFILREDQKRCIVRYRLEMRYRSEVMNRILPSPGMCVDRYIFVLVLRADRMACPVFFRKIKKRTFRFERGSPIKWRKSYGIYRRIFGIDRSQ